MWIATLESEDGSWFDDPLGADSKEEAIACARKEWKIIDLEKAKLVVVIYQCSQEDTIEKW